MLMLIVVAAAVADAAVAFVALYPDLYNLLLRNLFYYLV